MNDSHPESCVPRLFVQLTLKAMALAFLLTAAHAVDAQQPAAPQERWTEAQANAWYAQQPWLVGANFLPSTAINELEMWQAETLRRSDDRPRAGLGRRHRHEHYACLSAQSALGAGSEGISKSASIEFLTIAARHHIRPVFVLFDSCWDPMPKLGPQHPPIPGVHNSGWVQAPGAEILSNPASIRAWRAT